MNKYLVVTPPYDVQEDIVVDGMGPWCQVADTVEVEADNAEDAIAFGVGLMLNDPSFRKYKWCKDQRSEGLNPYAGVKAFDYNIMGNMVDELEPDPLTYPDTWLYNTPDPINNKNEGDMVEPNASEANAMDPEWVLNFEEPPNPDNGGWDEDS